MSHKLGRRSSDSGGQPKHRNVNRQFSLRSIPPRNISPRSTSPRSTSPRSTSPRSTSPSHRGRRRKSTASPSRSHQNGKSDAGSPSATVESAFSKVRDTLKVDKAKNKRKKKKGIAYSVDPVEIDFPQGWKYQDPFEAQPKALSHDFKPVSIPHNKAEYCDHCGEAAWGLYRQVLRCSICDFIVHRKCESKVIIDCSQRLERAVLQQDQLVNKTRAAEEEERKGYQEVPEMPLASSSVVKEDQANYNPAYIEALKHGKEPISYVRVMFLGEGGSGKSSVLDGLMKKKFIENKDSTMLAETRNISYLFVDAGKGDWNEMDEKAEVTELAKKVTKGGESSSVNEQQQWPQAEEEFGEETAETTDSLGEPELVPELAEKVSVVHKRCCRVIYSRAEQLEEHISSSESHDVLNVWDCGGQPVFLDILSAFITARTMFLLLFDASTSLFCKKVRETCVRLRGSKIPKRRISISPIQLMVQWMQLIYASFVCTSGQSSSFPRIMMIGSRGDKMDGSKQTQIVECLQQKYRHEAFNQIVLPGPLIIDNTTAGEEEEDPGYGKIREAVHWFATDLTVETPNSWILFRTVLKDTVAGREGSAKYMLSFNEVVTIAKSCNIPNQSVNGLLEFYHELGVFLHYAKIDLLKETVFTDPQWLFQQFCKLLMPECFESQLQQIPVSYTTNLRKYGILQLTQDVDRTISKVCGLSPECLVTLLEHFNLAKKVIQCPDVFQHTKGDMYFIPCMLEMDPSSDLESTDQGPTSHQSAATLHIVFKMGFVPPGFFVRLAAQMTTKFEPLFDSGVYRDSVTFGYRDYDTVTISEPSSLLSIRVDFVEVVKRKSSKDVFADSCLAFRNELYDMCINVLCWLPQIELFFAFSCKRDEHFIDLKMKKLDGHVSSEKQQLSPMYCKKCLKELEIKPEHKCWLPNEMETSSQNDGSHTEKDCSATEASNSPLQHTQAYVKDTGSAGTTSSRLDEKPTLPKMIRFHTSGKATINIFQQIGKSYRDLGLLLLDDENGAIVNSVVTEYQLNAVDITREILTRWINGAGIQPVTWKTLTDTLQDIGLTELASTIEKSL